MPFSIIIEVEGLEASLYQEMVRRFRNWRKIRYRLREIWVARQRQYYANAPVGKMQNLGPKVLKGDISKAGKKYFTAGTKVNYATYYNAWRKANGQGPLLMVDDRVVNDLAEAVTVWTLYGEGSGKITGRNRMRRPRKRRAG